MNSIIQYMLTDITEVFQYIPVGMISGILFFAFALIMRQAFSLLKKDNLLSVARCATMSLFIMYLTIFLEIVFLSREPGSRTEVNLQLFGTWGTNAQAHAYVLENILLFIPFGFLIPCVFPKCRNGVITFFMGIFLSIACEGIQFITQRGYCQLDDVVMNTLGTVLGYIGYGCIYSIFYLIRKWVNVINRGSIQ